MHKLRMTPISNKIDVPVDSNKGLCHLSLNKSIVLQSTICYSLQHFRHISILTLYAQNSKGLLMI